MSTAAPAPDRRAVLGGSLALASAVAATAAPAALAQTEGHPSPDATLLAACAAYLAAEARWTEIDAFGDIALNRYIAPPVPAALHFQGDTDHALIGSPHLLDRIEIDGKWVRHYASEQEVGDLRQSLARWRHGGYSRRLIDRGDAILAALDVYAPEVERAEDAAGVTAFHEMTRENQARLDALLYEITTTPATTMEGVIAKAQAATFHVGGTGGLDFLAGDALPRLLVSERGSEVFGRSTLAIVMSVIVDAARLGALVATAEAA